MRQRDWEGGLEEDTGKKAERLRRQQIDWEGGRETDKVGERQTGSDGWTDEQVYHSTFPFCQSDRQSQPCRRWSASVGCCSPSALIRTRRRMLA